MSASHVIVQAGFSDTLFLIQLPANALVEAADDGPSTGVLSIYLEDPDGVLGSWLQLSQRFGEWTSKQMINLSFCLPLFYSLTHPRYSRPFRCCLLPFFSLDISKKRNHYFVQNSGLTANLKPRLPLMVCFSGWSHSHLISHSCASHSSLCSQWDNVIFLRHKSKLDWPCLCSLLQTYLLPLFASHPKLQYPGQFVASQHSAISIRLLRLYLGYSSVFI